MIEHVHDMNRRVIEFLDSRPLAVQETDEICPRCGATMIALRQPSNVRGCVACQDTYRLNLERKIAFMEGAQS